MQLGLGIALVQGVTPASAPGASFYAHSLAYSATSQRVACGFVGATNYYTSVAELAQDVVLYQDDALTTPAPDGFYSNGFHVIEVAGDSGIIVFYDPDETACLVFALAPTALNYTAVDPATACALGAGETDYYFSEDVQTLYLDQYGVTPAPAGYYSNGFLYYTVTAAGAVDSGTGCE